MDFLVVITELFFTMCYCWGATSEYRLEVGVFAGVEVGHFDPKFHVEGDVLCARVDRPVSAVQLFCGKFSHKKNFVADFLREKSILTKNDRFSFL